jgi:hypothetical protein
MFGPRFQSLTTLQLDLLNYQADMEDQMDEMDYSHHGDAAGEIRDADIAFIAKIARAVKENRPIWSSQPVRLA